ncbi:MAG: hypothetical protein OCC46_12635 [Pseudodesulfovibrio sp.]
MRYLNKPLPKAIGVLCLLIIMTCTLVQTARSADKKVMVINSYHAEYQWVAAHNSALKAKLAGKADLSFYHLDTKRIPSSQFKSRVDTVFAAFTKEQPDVVVLTDDYAVMTLGKRISITGTPVVFLGVNGNPRDYLGEMLLTTGVIERPLYKRSIVYIQELLNNSMENCLVLFDDGKTSQAITEYVFHGAKSLQFSSIVTDVSMCKTFPEWKERVLQAKKRGYGFIILGLFHTLRDENGKHVPAELVANWTSKNSPVPFFAFWDFAIGKGKAIGGLVLAGEPQGEIAAEFVLRILAGQKPSTISPATSGQGQLVFSRSELKRWGINPPLRFYSGKESMRFVE